MSNRKKGILLTVCVCLLLLIIITVVPFFENFLLRFGYIHLSENELTSYFEKNKEDFQIVADYVLDRCTFYDENIATQELDKEFKPGEMIQYIDILYWKKGYYSCMVYNKITGNKEKLDLLKEIKPYNISQQLRPSFDKTIKNMIAVYTEETIDKSTYVNFRLKGAGFTDEQCIVYFKEKEHDFEFQFGYRVVPLSEEGWYYLEMSDAAHR